jgi:hypothetical protein
MATESRQEQFSGTQDVRDSHRFDGRRARNPLAHGGDYTRCRLKLAP